MCETQNEEGHQPTDYNDVIAKVGGWLETEGYPVEFRVANTFRKHGFHAVQGCYVQDKSEGSRREIDVLASMDVETSHSMLRLSNVVECKWPQQKPWVIFTSPTTSMAPSACIAQTISSELGEAVIWAIAGNETIRGLEIFSTPDEGGFGGRQAFTKGNDHFYSSVQGVVSNCSSYVAEADGYAQAEHDDFLGYAAIALPIVAVDGDLLSASFDVGSSRIVLTPVGHVRCHWRGSASREAFSKVVTVDIVSMKTFDEFVKVRAEDSRVLLKALVPTLDEIAKCAASKSLEPLTITEGPRGFIGLPRFLRKRVGTDSP